MFDDLLIVSLQTDSKVYLYILDIFQFLFTKKVKKKVDKFFPFFQMFNRIQSDLSASNDAFYILSPKRN